MTVELAPSPSALSAIPAPPHDTPVSVVVCTSPAPADGLIRGLRRAPGVEVVGVTTSGVQAERLVSSQLPDVALVDLHVPGIDGIGITRRVRSASPSTKVAMLTLSDTDTDLYDALKAGACGYVNRNSEVAEIATAVRSVGTGKLVIPTHLASDVLHDLEVSGAIALTATERVTLAAIAHGEARSKLGEILHLADGNAHQHIEAIYAKLHLAHRLDVVRTGSTQGVRQPTVKEVGR